MDIRPPLGLLLSLYLILILHNIYTFRPTFFHRIGLKVKSDQQVGKKVGSWLVIVVFQVCNVLLFIPSQKCLRIVAEVRVNIYHCVFAPAQQQQSSLSALWCGVGSGASDLCPFCNHVCHIIAISHPIYASFYFAFKSILTIDICKRKDAIFA